MAGDRRVFALAADSMPATAGGDRLGPGRAAAELPAYADQPFLRGHPEHVGIRHIYIEPATPRLNGKVERSHRIDGEESYRQLRGVVIDDTALFNDKLAEWEAHYNRQP